MYLYMKYRQVSSKCISSQIKPKKVTCTSVSIACVVLGSSVNFVLCDIAPLVPLPSASELKCEGEIFFKKEFNTKFKMD